MTSFSSSPIPCLRRPGRSPRPAALAWLAGAILAATTTGSGCGSDPCDALADGLVARAVDHGGQGQELAVALAFRDGVPREADLARCLSLEGANAAETAVVKRPPEAAFTLLLVDPGETPAENALVRTAVRALVERRPAGEKIALFRWGEETTQVVPFLGDRPGLEQRLDTGLAPAAAAIAPAASALGVAVAALAGVSAPGTVAQRTLVIVSPRAVPPLPAERLAEAANLVVWLGPALVASSLTGLPEGLRFAFGAPADLTGAATRLSESIDAHRRHGHYTLATCGAPDINLSTLRTGRSTRQFAFHSSADAPGGTCSAPRLAREGARSARRIELIFSPEQRTMADTLHSQRSKDDFDLMVRMSPDSEPVTATAHYRGESTYACARRNYSVNLAGKSPRFVFPGFAQDKFHLVSMCQDRFYLRNLLVLTTLAAEGLFPVPFDLVDLVVDGKDQGVYLLLENAADSLRVQQSHVRSVIRRYKVPGIAATAPEVRWVAAPAVDADALTSYQQILAGVDGLQGEALEAGLRRRLHLDQYFLWTAILNGFQSGDYVDEVFFYATETTQADGTRGDLHLVMGWDQDDAFAACHFSGTLAIYDTAGLLECSESELDRRIFGDPYLYRRYAEVLGSWLDRLTVPRLAQTLRASADRLLSHFRDPAVLAAMSELAATSPDAVMSFDLAQTLIEKELELLVTQYAARQQTLRAGLARLGTGIPREPSLPPAVPEVAAGDLVPLRTEPAPAVLDPARVVAPASGTRLWALSLAAADPTAPGGGAFAGFRDTQLGVRCGFSKLADGSYRCLPARALVAALPYQDPACTTPVQVRPASACEPPAYLGLRTALGCPGAEVIYRTTVAVPSTGLFVRDPAGACTPVPAPPASDVIYALEEVPLTAFVAATALPPTAARLGVLRLMAEDGAHSPAGMRDQQRGHLCAFLSTTDGELRCLPPDLPVVQGTVFADDQCRQPAAVSPPDSCTRAEQVIRPVAARCDTRFVVSMGGDRVAPRQPMAGRCLPAATAASPGVYPQGAEIPATTFAGGFTTGTPTATGRLRPLFRAGVDAAIDDEGFYDDERKLFCSPDVAADGTLRCLPRSEGDLGLFSDPVCRTALVSARLGCTPPTLVRERVTSACPARTRLFRVGPAHFGFVYTRDATARCVPIPFPPQSLFRLGPEVPAADFAPLALREP